MPTVPPPPTLAWYQVWLAGAVAVTRDVSVTLHRALSRGVAMHDALRDAQLAAMQGPPSAWAAFQLHEVR